MWEIESGAKTPYGDLSLAQTAMQVVMEDLRLKKPIGCIDEFYEIMQRLWNKRASKRPTMEDVVKEVEAVCGKFDNTEYFKIPDGEIS